MLEFYPIFKLYGTVLEEKVDIGERLDFLGNDSFIDITEEDEI
jgi:hypothetical protein